MFQYHLSFTNTITCSTCLLQIELMRKFFRLFSRRRNAGNRTARNSNSRASNLLRHSLGLFRVVHPRSVELKWTFRLTLFAISVGINAGVPTVLYE